MAVLDVDAMLEPVRNAPSEGEALKQLSNSTKVALQAIRQMLNRMVPGEKDTPQTVKGKVEELEKEIDNLIDNMTIYSKKVEDSMVQPRSKAPILPPPPEKPAEAKK